MVMQRIANPPTPVRFRLRPPHSKAPQINVCGAFLWARFGGSLPQFFESLPQPEIFNVGLQHFARKGGLGIASLSLGKLS